MVVLTIEQIQKEVAGFFNIPVERLSEDTRKRDIVKPRQIAMSLSHEFKTGSDRIIGNKFNRDRTSVIHACTTVSNESRTNKKYASEVLELRRKLENVFGNEEWKDIPGFEELYQASNFGNIRRLSKIVNSRSGRSYYIESKIFKCRDEVRFYKKNISYRKSFIHTVAITWIPNPDNFRYAVKIDSKKGLEINNIKWSSDNKNIVK
jgi:hypothetical protein